MNKQQTKEIIKNLQISEISLGECYDWYDMDKLESITSPLFKSIKELCGEELWDWITRWVYECPYMIEKNGYVKCKSDGVEYELENIEDFLDYLIIIEYITK